MLTTARLLASLLAAEQHRGEIVRFLPQAAAGRPDQLPPLPDDERPLVAAAAALAAGEPKRALRALANAGDSGEKGAVAGALRLAARTLDLNRYPGGGGAVISQEDIAAMTGEVPTPEDRGAMVVVWFAARLIPRMQTARAIAAEARREDHPGVVEADVAMLQKLGPGLGALAGPAIQAYCQLAAADVLWRAGRTNEARETAGACRDLAADDPIGLAHVNLTLGDWAIEPYAHPETLGLQLGVPRPDPVTETPDPVRARWFYDQAASGYAQATTSRGLAAVALRRAHIARRAGDGHAADRPAGGRAGPPARSGSGAPSGRDRPRVSARRGAAGRRAERITAPAPRPER